MNKKDPDYVVVYSTDKPTCPGCHREYSKCSCGKALFKTAKPKVRIERKGRGGKTVTILAPLPARQELLKDLCGTLKRALGTGGTFHISGGEGTIEIQGEHSETLLAHYQRYIERT